VPPRLLSGLSCPPLICQTQPCAKYNLFGSAEPQPGFFFIAKPGLGVPGNLFQPGGNISPANLVQFRKCTFLAAALLFQLSYFGTCTFQRRLLLAYGRLPGGEVAVNDERLEHEVANPAFVGFFNGFASLFFLISMIR